MTKAISIVMAHYNMKPNYLRRAIMSVADQEGLPLEDLELVVVDDFSDQRYRDFAERAVEGSRSRYPDLDVRLAANRLGKGLGNARNTGILDSRGEYVGILDSDDELEPEAVATMLSRINGADFAFSDHTKYDEQMADPVYVREKADCHAHYVEHKGTPQDPLLHMCYPGAFIVYRKGALADTGGYRDIPMAEDFDLVLRVSHLKHDVNCAHIPRSLYRYRHNPTSISNGKRDRVVSMTKATITETLRMLGYDVDAVMYSGRVSPTNSSFFDLIVGGKRADVPWLDRGSMTIREQKP